MQKCRAWLAALLTALLLISAGALVAVAAVAPITAPAGFTIRLQVGSTAAVLNGNPTTLDVPPRIINSRTMVPLRFLAEATGAQVQWDGAQRKITIITVTNTIELWVDGLTARVNGKEQALDAPPVIVDNRTLAPLRFVVESLGAQVQWNGADQSIVVTPAGTAPVDPTPANPGGAAGAGHLYYRKGNYIYVAAADGSGETQLTTTGADGLKDANPQPSPDGKSVAYSHKSIIYVVPAAGGDVRQVASQWMSDYPVWSPDGTEIALQMDYRNFGAFVGVNAVTVSRVSDAKVLDNYTNTGAPRSWPTWAHNGKSIVVTELQDGATYYFSLVTINLETKAESKLTDDPAHDYLYPVFSPSGDQIACIRADAGQSSGSLWVMNSDGTGGHAVTTGAKGRPAWSPDGTVLAFTRPDGIYTVPAAGGDAALLVAGGTEPAWGR